jgi:hypothetical protein
LMSCLGLKTAPATFQRAMQNVLAGCQHFCRVHVNNIIIYSKTSEEHYEHLRIVLGRLRDANLKVAPAKCKFGITEVKYLGHIVDRTGHRPDPEQLQAVQDTPQPKTMSQLKGLLGLSGYYRAYYETFAQMVHPLAELTKKGADVAYWWDNVTATAEAAFKACKRCQLVDKQLMEPHVNHLIPVHSYFQRWHIDPITPLTTIPRGFKHLIVAINAATKRVEAGCLMNRDACTVKE